MKPVTAMHKGPKIVNRALSVAGARHRPISDGFVAIERAFAWPGSERRIEVATRRRERGASSRLSCRGWIDDLDRAVEAPVLEVLGEQLRETVPFGISPRVGVEPGKLVRAAPRRAMRTSS